VIYHARVTVPDVEVNNVSKVSSLDKFPGYKNLHIDEYLSYRRFAKQVSCLNEVYNIICSFVSTYMFLALSVNIQKH